MESDRFDPMPHYYFSNDRVRGKRVPPRTYSLLFLFHQRIVNRFIFLYKNIVIGWDRNKIISSRLLIGLFKINFPFLILDLFYSISNINSLLWLDIAIINSRAVIIIRSPEKNSQKMHHQLSRKSANEFFVLLRLSLSFAADKRFPVISPDWKAHR